MSKIEIITFWASNDEDLKDKLNRLSGRIISVENTYDHFYKVIYEIND